MKKTLFLLDGMALIYRAYFAFIRNPRITSKGQDVSAIFGFLNTLLDIINTYSPTHIMVALDTSAPTFRHKIFSVYKANRDETPEGIRYAVPMIKKLLQAFNITVLEKDGYEADDIIGTLVKFAENKEFKCTMITPDKDFAQLVSSNISIIKPGRGGKEAELLDIESILEQWNISNISQVIDILGLAGDASDNIPGVPGIGPKTAQKLIKQYGSVENLIKNTSELTGKLKENIEEYQEQALLSKKLVTINCNVPIAIDIDEFRYKNPNSVELKKILTELEFKTFLKRFFTNKNNSEDKEEDNLSVYDSVVYKKINDFDHQYLCINNTDEIVKIVDNLSSSDSISFDIETTSLNIQLANIVGISLCNESHKAFYFPFPNNRTEVVEKLKIFEKIFKNPNIKKIGQNIKFVFGVLLNHGVKIEGDLLDIMVAHYLIDPERRHNMDFMAKTELNYEPILFNDLIGHKKSEQKLIRDVDIQLISEYASEYADISFQIWKILKDKLKSKGLENIFYNIEMPLLKVLAYMEYRGVNIDTKSLKKYSKILEEKLKKLEESIYTKAGMEFNLNSPKQLGDVLFEILRIIEKPKKTKTGQYQTNEDILNELINKHPIIKEILEFRQLNKLKSTYVDALPQTVIEKTEKIHTTFSQSITTTGRLSSSHPNLQNIPIKSEEGQRIRQAFIPQKKYSLLACDYSQIELRVMAELSKDKNLCEAFISNEDVHTTTASNIFNAKLEDVSRDMRNKAKMVNFGIIYGISAFGLAKRLNISRNEASEIINQYKSSYPDVQNYLMSTIKFAEKNEYVETITGRRRYIRDINSNNKMIKAGAERNAINAPIQGTAADMIKIAMINIESLLQKERVKTKMLLQVHDELVFDLWPEEKEYLLPKIEKLMKSAIPMKIPIVIQSGIGRNWLEAH